MNVVMVCSAENRYQEISGGTADSDTRTAVN